MKIMKGTCIPPERSLSGQRTSNQMHSSDVQDPQLAPGAMPCNSVCDDQESLFS